MTRFSPPPTIVWNDIRTPFTYPNEKSNARDRCCRHLDDYSYPFTFDFCYSWQAGGRDVPVARLTQ